MKNNFQLAHHLAPYKGFLLTHDLLDLYIYQLLFMGKSLISQLQAALAALSWYKFTSCGTSKLRSSSLRAQRW
jgi:hypothetical protein